jgi:hypothetical protein
MEGKEWMKKAWATKCKARQLRILSNNWEQELNNSIKSWEFYKRQVEIELQVAQSILAERKAAGFKSAPQLTPEQQKRQIAIEKQILQFKAFGIGEDSEVIVKLKEQLVNG